MGKKRHTTKRGRMAARRVQGGGGWVYVLSCEGRAEYKVGKTTTRPKRRVSSLQTGNPARLRVVRTFETKNAANAEALMHTALGPWRTLGEWFDCPLEMVTAAWGQVQAEWPEGDIKAEGWEASHRRLELWAKRMATPAAPPAPAVPPRQRKRAPAPPVNMRAKLGLIMPPTREEVMAKWPKAAGGHTRKQLAEWGVEWPPPKGWIDRLEFRRAEIERKIAKQRAGSLI